MPEIFASTFIGTVDNTIDFIKLLEALPCKENVSLALELAFNVLETTEQAETEQALHLWAFCVNFLLADDLPSDYECSGRIYRTRKAMEKNKVNYFDIYQTYIDEPLTHDIAALHIPKTTT
jgi:hypothetical protein